MDFKTSTKLKLLKICICFLGLHILLSRHQDKKTKITLTFTFSPKEDMTSGHIKITHILKLCFSNSNLHGLLASCRQLKTRDGCVIELGSIQIVKNLVLWQKISNLSYPTGQNHARITQAWHNDWIHRLPPKNHLRGCKTRIINSTRLTLFTSNLIIIKLREVRIQDNGKYFASFSEVRR